MFINFESDGLKEVVSNIDSLDNLRTLLYEEIDFRSEEVTDMWHSLRIKDSQLFQNFWSKYLQECDTNFGFYHAYMKSKCRQNAILALKVGECWIEMISKIKQ